MKEVDCSYKEGIINEVIDGIEIEYLEKYYVCDVCGCKIYGDLLDYNVSVANNELRKNTGLITVSEIEEIINRYSIGKKPLSVVLGLGEITITRYLEGSNPSKENSDLLKRILNSPMLYEMYLEVNKDKITDVAYKKSLGKSKIYNVCLYFISKLKEIDALSLQKLLYFSNGISNYFLGNNLINDVAQSWKYGPVYKEVYDCFSYYGYNKLDYNELVKDKNIDLSDEEKKFLDVIIDSFGFYSGGILREMSHLTDPWINTRVGLMDDEPSNRIISLDEMNEYFSKIIKKYKIKDIHDISKYSEDLFLKAKEKLMIEK